MSQQRKRKREKEKEKTFGEGWDLFCGGEDKQRRKRRKIIGRKKSLGEEKGKGGKYLEKENIFFCGGEGQKEKLLYMGGWVIAYWLWSKMLVDG